eukprot:PhM_4_TR4615/c0_g1_i1/m.95162/K19681/IFT52; intraflagellar transport protein 52
MNSDPKNWTQFRDTVPNIAFDVSKKETYHPGKGLRTLQRKLKQNFSVEVYKDEFTLEKLKPFDVLVLSHPTESFSKEDCHGLQQYLDQGGSILVSLGELKDGKQHSISPFLNSLGITPMSDCVLRTVYQKYFHPKEVCISNGVLNREITRAAGKGINGSMTFVYPYGVTFSLQRPAVPILSSGFMSHPLSRPISAVWESPKMDPETKRRGKLLVVGSSLMIEDAWIDKEENSRLVDVFFQFLLHQMKLNQIDAEEPELADSHTLPDTAALADRLRVCVEEPDELPRDFTKLFDLTQFRFDTDLVPEVVQLYNQLSVKHEPLTLIHPEFETPLPPVLPATFPPTHRDLPPPALDLFDLDEHFASERSRLAQVTNKCSNEDLPYYIQEAGDILGVTKKLRSPRNKDPRAILEHIFKQIVHFKKQNQDELDGPNANSESLPSPREPIASPTKSGASGGGRKGVQEIIISGIDDGSRDLSPFDANAPWELSLKVDYDKSTVEGTWRLDSTSGRFKSQSCTVMGIVMSGEEHPLQWKILARNMLGQNTTFQFKGSASDSTLSGTWEEVASNSVATQSGTFMYSIGE